jgi:hypothetical protein
MGNARDAYLDFIYHQKQRHHFDTICDALLVFVFPELVIAIICGRRNFVYMRVEMMMMAFTSYCGVVLWEKQGRRRRTGDDCEQAVKVLQVLAACVICVSVCMRV